jgi:hypothetical protein
MLCTDIGKVNCKFTKFSPLSCISPSWDGVREYELLYRSPLSTFCRSKLLQVLSRVYRLLPSPPLGEEKELAGPGGGGVSSSKGWGSTDETQEESEAI